MTPQLQKIVDDFSTAADAAVHRASGKVNRWKLRKERRSFQENSSTLVPSHVMDDGLGMYMGVPIARLLSGEEEWPV